MRVPICCIFGGVKTVDLGVELDKAMRNKIGREKKLYFGAEAGSKRELIALIP
jgi:hypothetical protein